jgi:hypothetical protein
MRKFEQYSVYVNFADRAEVIRLRQAGVFAMKGDEMMVNWFDSTGRELAEITEDKAPSYEARDYEHRVYELLRLIRSVKIGKCVLDSLDKCNKYWILPTAYPTAKRCRCGANTFPGSPKGRGGERIHFEPRDWKGSASVFDSADVVLFHELVHASRQGRVGFFGEVAFGFDGYSGLMGAEEFFATQMMNVYLSNRGSRIFYRTYDYGEAATKEEAYRDLCRVTPLRVFRYFLDNDPLAKEVARWTHPADSFNPWRDLPMLEKAFLARSPQNRLPPFVPPAWRGR